MKAHTILMFGLLALLLTGCGNAGMFLSSNSTEVQLKEGNYKIVATNVTGEADQAYLFGVSYSWGITTNSIGLIPLGGSDLIYKEAREQLWGAFEQAHFPVEGKRLALVNVQYDSETTNFGIYTQAKVTITADVIEFD